MEVYEDIFTGQFTFTQPRASIDKASRLWKQFLNFHYANLHIYENYKTMILNAIDAGVKEFSISLLTERQRWGKVTSSESWKIKINNNHRAYYARLFVEDYPEHKDFFKLRSVKKE